LTLYQDASVVLAGPHEGADGGDYGRNVSAQIQASWRSTTRSAAEAWANA
jgi:hypothetical protein